MGLAKILWSDSAYSPLACCVQSEIDAAQREDNAAHALEEFDDEEEEVWEGLIAFIHFFF